MTQPELAKAIGVHAITVAKYEAGSTGVKTERLAKIAAALRTTPAALLGEPTASVRGSSHTGEGTNGDRPGEGGAEVPLRRHAVRVWLREFELELVRAGATDDEIANARTLLTRPEALTFYVGGHFRDATEEETLMGMEAMAEFIRDRLTLKGRKFK